MQYIQHQTTANKKLVVFKRLRTQGIGARDQYTSFLIHDHGHKWDKLDSVDFTFPRHKEKLSPRMHL